MKNFCFCLILFYCSFQFGLLAAGLKAISLRSEQKCEDQDFPEPPCCGISSYKNTTGRIYYGEIAGLNEFPWMVYLNYSKFSVTLNENNGLLCAGSLINSRWVLTATHCVPDNDPDYYQVHLGEWKLRNNPDCITPDTCAPDVLIMGIDKVIRHESFSLETYLHDVALVRLERPVTYTDFIKPICLPPKEWKNRNFASETVILSGWGKIESHEYPTELRKLLLQVIHPDECNNRVYSTDKMKMFKLCAGAEGRKGACAGDSGGPLSTVQLKDNISLYYQIGITSTAYFTNFTAEECGGMNTDSTYTKVVLYLDWIKEVIQKHQ